MPAIHPATEFFKQCLKAGDSPDEATAKTIRIFGTDDARVARTEAKEEIRKIYIMRDPPILVDHELAEWYPGPSEDDRFWPALKRYLVEKADWSEDSIRDLDRASSQVVSRIAPPGMAEIRSRGLVVGYVQSGKTANFTAVIAKAADVNYRIFVVLSGLTNSLRAQTQERLDRELVGLSLADWLTLTDSRGDFGGNIPIRPDAVFSRAGTTRVLAVLKKNGARLRRFVNWLAGSHPDMRRNCAILVIDDEADQASINTAENEAERSKINALIVRLLREMPKAAYVGYTATPFANVLNEPPGADSLYPSHFIITLPPSPSYFGPERIFGRERLRGEEEDGDIDGLDMIRDISDEEERAMREAVLSGEFHVSGALDEALRFFLMATAARVARHGGVKFSSMLVHTTQRVHAHYQMQAALVEYRAGLIARLESGDAQLMAEMRTQWESECARVRPAEAGCSYPAVSFDSLSAELPRITRETEFIVDNYISPARLDFSVPGKTVVVIGGNTLSRGLTVEGLVTSYFMRTSTAYDTLLQMGRWFGFRKGYEDLPRIWMTGELRDYFFDLATVEAEFRAEVRRYTLGLTPVQFGPRIRTHPDLSITSRLKMQRAVDVDVSFGGHCCQTILFHHRRPEWLASNAQAARKLLAEGAVSAGSVEAADGGRVRLFNVPVSHIITFFESYSFHQQSRELKRELLIPYVKAQNQAEALKLWNVVVLGKKASGLGRWDTGHGEVGLINRSRMRETDADRGVTANIKSLMSKEDIVADLEWPADMESVDHEELLRRRNGSLPRHGLLLLYPISKDSLPARKRNGEENLQREPLGAVADVVGVAVVLPEPNVPTPQGYKTIDMSDAWREEPEYPEEPEDREDEA